MTKGKSSDLSKWLGGVPKRSPAAPGRPCVLIIDDDENILEALNLALRDKYVVRLCAESTKWDSHMDESVDVVVLDIKMSGRDGFWVYEAIRKRFEHTPIIFNSAHQDVRNPNEVMNEFRPFGYVVKGERLEQLQGTIESAVQHGRSIRKTARLIHEARETKSAKSEAGKLPVVIALDDDPATLHALRLSLSKHYDLRLFVSSDACIKEVEQSYASAIILDLKMRGADGFEVCAEIRRRDPYIPVIFYSAYTQLRDPYEVMNTFRPFAYITKDGDARKVNDIVASAVDHYQRFAAHREVMERLRSAKGQAASAVSLLTKKND